MIFPLFEPTFYEAEGRAVTMARQAGGGACRARPRGERIFVASRSAEEVRFELTRPYAGRGLANRCHSH